ncbi:MAG: hypothetical protein V3W31_01675 [Thermodesulfobacteriota bacterium]
MAKKKKEQEIKGGLPIEWHVPDTIITRFVTNMTVQVIEYEFKLSFFELKPEIILGPTPKLPKKIKADCVASVIVTPDRLASFIKVLKGQLDLYNEAKKATTSSSPTEP